MHPDDSRAGDERRAAARERGEPFELEYRVVRADGSVRWVLDQMDTVYEARHTALRARLPRRRHRAQESEQLFRAVFDSAFEAMIISNDEGRYVE